MIKNKILLIKIVLFISLILNMVSLCYYLYNNLNYKHISYSINKEKESVELKKNNEDMINQSAEVSDNYPTECGYKTYEVPYTLPFGYSFYCTQVYDMENEELENKINENLSKYFSIFTDTWFGGAKTIASPPIIHLQTDRYLSVEYVFNYITADNLYWHLCVTVDMQSGELIYLDDLVNLDEGFVKLIKYGKIFKCEEVRYELTAEEVSQRENEYFSKRDTTYILNYFKDFTNPYLYGDYYRQHNYIMEDYEPYIYNTYFYLENGVICCTPARGKDTPLMYKIMTDDIEEYLKVPNW